ncbi:MAG: sortase B protein-sorting domain-containing protein [Parasporobacterium sp.]|nr:sortase B protein-sorting domain-containing protein [Parasporobacterium sp.]
MKKKITSFIIMLAVLVSMLSTTVFADTESSKTQLETIKSQMQQTADFILDSYIDEMERRFPTQYEFIKDYSYVLHYLNKTGIESAELDNLNNIVLSNIKNNISANNGIITDIINNENIEDYFPVISFLLSIGEDPTNIVVNNTKYDIVARLNTLLKDPEQLEKLYGNSGMVSMALYEPVYRYYKDNYDGIAAECERINERVLNLYIKSGVRVPDRVFENEISILGIDTVLNKNEYYIEDNYVMLVGDDEDAWGALLAKLNNSNLPDAGYYHNDDESLCLERLLKDGFAFQGFGPTANAFCIRGLTNSLDDTKAYKTSKLDNPQTTVTVNEAVTTALSKIHDSINEIGFLIDNNYGGAMDPFYSTSICLVVTSLFNRLGDADKLYEGFNSLYDANNIDPELAETAIMALSTYYYAKSGSTIVTLSPEYLSTLAPGEHTIRVQSANGYAETTLNIVATPQTGDSSNMGLFVTLTACGLGMAVVAVARKVKAER